MDVIGRHHIIEDAQPESFARFIEPMKVAVSVPGELEQEISLVASMCEMPDMTRQEMTIGTRHGGAVLNLSFRHQKSGFKRAAGLYSTDLFVWINVLLWSDPDPKTISMTTLK
jgi:hypothetical protein